MACRGPLSAGVKRTIGLPVWACLHADDGGQRTAQRRDGIFMEFLWFTVIRSLAFSRWIRSESGRLVKYVTTAHL